MKVIISLFVFLCLLSIGSMAAADIFFEEQFNGPSLDPSVWRTEILTSNVRWCDSYPGAWQGPGYWVDEGSACYGVPAYSPYGSAVLSEGLVHLSSSNGRAFPLLVSRLPGTIALFPALGDFTLRVNIRSDRITPWGTTLVVLQTQSTEPSGTTSLGRYSDMLLQISGGQVWSALGTGGDAVPVAYLPSPYELHEVALACFGNAFTISIDGEVVFGPVTDTLRPTAVFMGNPSLAYWYPTDWQWFSVDYFRVEVPGPATGACCLPEGVCLQGTETDCATAGGAYVGAGVSCDPDPCGATPVGASTWGHIKAAFR